MDPVSVLILEAALKAAVSEGVKVLPDAAVELWGKMKGLLGRWGGKRKSRVEGAIEDVVENPNNESLQEVLGTQIKAIGDEPDTELQKVAEQLKELIEADEKASAATAGIQQAVQKVTGSAVAQAVHGDATATNTYTEKNAVGIEVGFIERLQLIQNFASSAFVEPSERSLLEGYLQGVIQQTRLIDLTGIDPAAVGQKAVHPELNAIYTDLDITRKEYSELGAYTRGEATSDAKTISVLNFCSATPHAVLLGDPGGGKSTFANILAFCLSAELLNWKEAGLQRLGEDWKAGALLPVRIVLRELAVAKLKETDPAERLWAHFVGTLPASYREAIADKLKKHLFEEGGIFILDGYDEAPEAENHRERVRESVLALRGAFPKARVLLTSRVYAYQRRGDQEWRLPDFEDATLAPFTGEQQEAFIDRWYGYCAQVRPSLSDEEAKGRATQLKQALKERPDLEPLAERPLLLTLMASLHAWRQGTLPEGREGLYEESVKLLLEQWQKPKMMVDEQGNPRLVEENAAEFLKVTPKKVTSALEQLAFEAHRDQEKQEEEADITLDQVVAALVRIAEDDVQPKQVIAYIRDRAGLLNDMGGNVYRFPHRTFQEYMAACYLTEHEAPDLLVRLLLEDPERWREAFLLAGAKLRRGGVAGAWGVVGALIAETGEKRKDDKAWQGLALCGQLLQETGLITMPIDQLAALARADRKRLTKLLETLVVKGRLVPAERAAAGRWLGLLGDLRSGIGVKKRLPDIEALKWIAIEPPEQGWFWMGEKKNWHGERKFKCDWITESYQIARYPVTVAQFQDFIDATGHEAEPLPSGFDHPNQPRTKVSWRDARAFCQWLSAETGQSVTLPNEAQWEYAARGIDGREFPWEGDFDSRRVNTIEGGIGRPSAVGLYPTGRSWCGADDLAGNVWEWTLTQWHEKHRSKRTPDDENSDETESPRVLRGGAWNYRSGFARCAARYRRYPNLRSNSIGFRVCVSPFSASGL